MSKANEKREKSWVREQLEDPEVFEAFCRELEREAERRGECRALLSLARWAEPNESALSDWEQGYKCALKDVADECRRRAKKGKP